MKRAGKCIVFTTLVVMALFFVGLIGDTPLTAQLAGSSRSQNIQTFVLDSFEDPNAWRAHFSLFAVKRFNESTRLYELDTTRSTWTNFVAKPWGVTSESETNRCLAVKASFDRRGYNWIEVYPVRPNAEGRVVHHPLPMKGRVSFIDVWVWGGNFDYRLELHLLDFIGHKHILDAGWLNFVGWRNIRLPVPAHIPQGEKYVPSLRVLRFEKFVLYAHPAERPDGFFVYFDRMQIQSDVHMERFDGDDLVELGYEAGWFPRQEMMR
jgi:hypothetical protein